MRTRENKNTKTRRQEDMGKGQGYPVLSNKKVCDVAGAWGWRRGSRVETRLHGSRVGAQGFRPAGWPFGAPQAFIPAQGGMCSLATLGLLPPSRTPSCLALYSQAAKGKDDDDDDPSRHHEIRLSTRKKSAWQMPQSTSEPTLDAVLPVMGVLYTRSVAHTYLIQIQIRQWKRVATPDEHRSPTRAKKLEGSPSSHGPGYKEPQSKAARRTCHSVITPTSATAAPTQPLNLLSQQKGVAAKNNIKV